MFTCLSTSLLVTRPLRPVPRIAREIDSMLGSNARHNRRNETDFLRRWYRLDFGGSWGTGAARATGAVGTTGAAGAAGPRWQRGCRGFNGLAGLPNEAPGCRPRGPPRLPAAMILSTVPEAGDGISVSTLSVLTSSRGSSSLIDSPSCLSHLVTVTSSTPSPSKGTSTLVVMVCLPMPLRASGAPENVPDQPHASGRRPHQRSTRHWVWTSSRRPNRRQGGAQHR